MNSKIDIALVNMPFCAIRYPSISLGLLKSILKREGISGKIFYGNIIFTEEVFLEFIKKLLKNKINSPKTTIIEKKVIEKYREYIDVFISLFQGKFLEDWLYGRIIFPDHKDITERYIKFLLTDKSFPFSDENKIKEIFIEFREKTGIFLKKFSEEILSCKPSIVGISAIYSQYIPSLALLKTVKDMSPDVITVMGGSHCETVTGLTTHKTFSFVDYIVSGEADDIISHLAGNILLRGRNIDKKELPAGVFAPVHRDRGYPEKLQCEPKYNMSGLPVPDYDEYFDTLNNLKELKGVIKPTLLIQTSRGCWWGVKKKCKFCAENSLNLTYRSRPPEEVIKELELLSLRYNIRKFMTTDSILDMNYFDTLLPALINSGSSWELSYETISTLNREQIKLLKEAGIIRILAGVESLHSDVLSLAGKYARSWQNILLLKLCDEYGIRIVWYYIYDFPGEKDEWHEKTARIVPLLSHLQSPRSIVRLSFLRNNEYYNKSQDYGLSIKPHQFYRHILTMSEETIKNIAFYFIEEKQIEREKDDMYPLLHSGLVSLKKEIKKWKNLFNSSERPELKLTVHGDRLEMEDSRPCRVKSSFIFTGLFREIYLYCDTGVDKGNILKIFKEKGYKEEEIISVIENILLWKLMIEIDGKLLSLAVRDGSKTLPPDF